MPLNDAICCATLYVWLANSAVGETITAWTSAKSSSKLLKIGTRNAWVFPEPVLLLTSRFLPLFKLEKTSFFLTFRSF